jgi:hypothetical protein
MSFLEKWKHERKPFDTPIRYYLFSQTDKFKMDDCEGVSIDVSEEGFGIVTGQVRTSEAARY